MVGTAYSTNGLFYSSLATPNNYTNYAMYNLVNRTWSDVKKADPFKGKSPSYKDYEGGFNDPQYIADYRAYYNDKYTHETAKLKEAIAQVAAQLNLPKLDKVNAFLDMSAEAVKAFEENRDYKKAIEATNFFNSLDLETQCVVYAVRCTAYWTYEGRSETATSPATTHLSAMPALVSSYAQYEKVADFQAYLATVKEPYTLEKALEAREKYEMVPEALRSYFTEEEIAKIDALTYITLTQNPSKDIPDISGYKKTTVTYPEGATKVQTTEALPKLDTLVNQLVAQLAGSDLKTLITNGLYTNATVASIHKAIGPVLGTLGIAGNVNPSGLLPYLATQQEDGTWVSNYEKWTGAVAALAKVAADTDNWDDVVYKNGDWFKDGDKQGFCDAFGVILMEAYNLKKIINVGQTLFNSLQFENKYDFKNNTYKTGSYENIVHIFEAVGIPCRDSVTYTENFNAQENDTDRMVARLSPILYDAFTFVEQFAVTPVTTLCEILPNVAYALNEGIIDENVHAILDRISSLLGIAGVTLPTLDFTAEGLFNTLGGLGIEGISFTEPSNSAGEPLNPNDGTLRITIASDEKGGKPTVLEISEKAFLNYLNAVQGCGEMVVADSICVNNAYRPKIVADKADVFVTTVRFAYEDVLLNNKDALKTIISASDEQAGNILGPVLDVMAKYMPADAVITALVNVANPYKPTLPDVNIGGGNSDGISGLIQKIVDFVKGIVNPDGSGDSGSNGGQPNTENPSVPKTGGSIVTSMFSLAATAALVGGALVFKRKQQDED